MIQTNMKNNIETGKVRKTILLIVATVLLLMLVVSFLICHYAIMKQAHVGYMGIMNVASEKISKREDFQDRWRYGDECPERV